MRLILKKFSIIALVAVSLGIGGCNNSEKSRNSEADSTRGIIEETVTPVAEDNSEIKEGIPTVIDFYATWCGPCKAIAPVFEKLKVEYAGKINFSRVDVDADEDMARKYNIEAMPTFVFLDANGKEVNRIVGADENSLIEAVKNIQK